jgi:hypothetical protein
MTDAERDQLIARIRSRRLPGGLGTKLGLGLLVLLLLLAYAFFAVRSHQQEEAIRMRWQSVEQGPTDGP